MPGYREDPSDAQCHVGLTPLFAEPDAVARTQELLGAFGRGDLGPPPELPVAVAERVSHTLDTLAAERSDDPAESGNSARPGDSSSTGALAPSTQDLPAVGISRPQPRTLSRTVALAVIGAAAALILSIALIGHWPNQSPPAQVAQSATPDPQLTASLMSAIGRYDGPFTAARVDRCLAANNVSVGTQTSVLGTTGVQVDGRDAVAMLLTTGQVGEFRAVVVGTDCDSGRPSLVRDTVIGHSPRGGG